MRAAASAALHARVPYVVHRCNYPELRVTTQGPGVDEKL